MYNYREVVKSDCIDAIREYIEYHEDEIRGMSKTRLEEKMYDEFFVEDSVTGNASGSYTFNAYEAEQNLSGNWDLAKEAMEEFGCKENPFDKGPEWVDVTIRCYLLGQCLADAMEEIDDEIEEAIAENEED